MEARRWLELRARCPKAGESDVLLVEGLLDLGARGVEERGGWYVAYLEAPDDPEDFASRALSALSASTGLAGIRVEWSWQEHEAWAESWKRGLDIRRITDRIVVRPSWIDPRGLQPGDIEIVLDPGMAFGTAEHGTTRGCLRHLDGTVRPGDHVLDVGAGSGILSIAAARLGAEEVVAVEGDAYACEALRDNVERNGVAALVRVVHSWADASDLAGYGPVDGLIANIETGLLLPLVTGFAAAVRPGGWAIASGILGDEVVRVVDAMCVVGFSERALDEDGEWRSVLFEVNPPSRGGRDVPLSPPSRSHTSG